MALSSAHDRRQLGVREGFFNTSGTESWIYGNICLWERRVGSKWYAIDIEWVCVVFLEIVRVPGILQLHWYGFVETVTPQKIQISLIMSQDREGAIVCIPLPSHVRTRKVTEVPRYKACKGTRYDFEKYHFISGNK